MTDNRRENRSADHEILDSAGVADYFQVSPETARREMASGAIPSVRVGRSYRARRSDLDAMFSDRSRR